MFSRPPLSHPLYFRSFFGILIVSGLLSGLMVTPGRAATPAEVDAAIQKAVAFIEKSQVNGNWEKEQSANFKTLDPRGGPGDDKFPATPSRMFGGISAIAAYSLLAAGESDQSPELKKCIKWLMDTEMRGLYSVGLRSQVWNLIPESKERNAARDRDKTFLLNALIEQGPNTGFYGYSYGGPIVNGTIVSLPTGINAIPPGGPKMADAWYDRSNSQYGVLGVWALEQAGAEIPQKYWETVDKGWKSQQSNDGGWSYCVSVQTKPEPAPEWSKVSVTMTSAGVATLFITQDYLMKGKSWEPCHGGVINNNIENGLKYMDRHINEAISGGNYYAMYGVERIGVASGHKYFGSVDWYKDGAQYLVSNQKPDGSWAGWLAPMAVTPTTTIGSVPETAFGLLFLVRGRAPVMMNKLEYDIVGREGNNANKIESPWNERPRDAANLAHWMGGRVENRYLNWQVVNLKVSVDDLHDAPILYISGSDELKFTNEEITKLRTFAEQGGLILGNANCNSEKFSKSFEKLGTTLFPKYEFRQIPTNHLIYTGEQYSTRKWKVHPRLRGLSNGVRELVLLIPDVDAGRAWQTDSNKTRQESFELAANIFLYSVDKRNLMAKGDTYIVHANTTPAAKHVKIARIETDGNWDPEPAGWPRLAAIMHNNNSIDLDMASVKLGSGKLAGCQFASLTGTTKFKFDDAQQKELKDFVAKGGTLVVDAAGGSTDFVESAEAQLPIIFGADANKGLASELPAGSPIYSAGKKIADVSYRTFTRRTITGKTKTPRLKGITIDGRLAVFYSREDLSAGLVGEQVDGIVGYDPKSSVDLMSNMILYASGNAVPVPAAAAAADAKGDESASK